ncbi:hypothetical protein BDV96DRAFT_293038 [Lophiotrema nucula]|uniref:Uncharacterized protein n=1 Tax=Lophiotrema nucula TaxID=690887 RepID=A0A6A5YMV6_9PLEO|nr:hypothetical protein BDV96DRAFT_293038 [Lophiotrema nucula]
MIWRKLVLEAANASKLETEASAAVTPGARAHATLGTTDNTGSTRDLSHGTIKLLLSRECRAIGTGHLLGWIATSEFVKQTHLPPTCRGCCTQSDGRLQTGLLARQGKGAFQQPGWKRWCRVEARPRYATDEIVVQQRVLRKEGGVRLVTQK